MLKQQMMYKCEACECVKLFGVDFGEVFMTMCEPCKVLRFFHRVYVARTSALYNESNLYCDDRKEDNDVKSDSK